jgi:antibiotic biosynthesis monooxygenase (ABM) superfamily enzyme
MKNVPNLFDVVAKQQGFSGLNELAEVASWLESPEVDPALLKDVAAINFKPKPEFKDQFESWLKQRASPCA